MRAAFAVREGLDAPEGRRAAGPRATGQVMVTVREPGAQVIIEVADDGRGIDWEAVRAKAVARTGGADRRGLAGGDPRRGAVDEGRGDRILGRGAGLAACESACRELGGTPTIRSVRGQGTTLRLSIPSDDAQVPRLTSVASAVAGRI